MQNIVLIGNPNCGKTTLFNKLTKNNAHIGNYPGITVNKNEKIIKYKHDEIKIIDLPGLYSIHSVINEEQVVLDYLLNNKVDLIINIVDATNLVRSLYLTTQLLEFNIPLIVALNMVDKIKNDDLPIKIIKEKLKVQVIPISALKNKNLQELLDISYQLSFTLKKATPILKDLNEKSYEEIATFRYQYLEKLGLNQLKKTSLSFKIDQILTNKYLAYPILFLILFLIFHLTFSNNLFFLKPLIKYLPNKENIFYSSIGFNGLGVILTNLINKIENFFVRKINVLLTDSSPWLISFLQNGVLKGLFSVFSFLPSILCLYMFFFILEDSGYLARVAFILDKPLSKIHLSGKAFLPLVMGSGCSIPAIYNSKVLDDDLEKVMVIRMLPYIYCSAKVPFIVAMCGVIALKFNIAHVDIITFIFYLFGLILALFLAYFFRNTTLKSSESTFIMELPNYKMISFKVLFKSLYQKSKDFLKKAFSVVLASTIIMWFLAHFSCDFKYLSDQEINQSLLTFLTLKISFVFTPLGFGNTLNSNYGYIFIIATISGLLAKENIIATLTSFSSYLFNSSNPLMSLIISSQITIGGLLSFIIFNLITLPCLGSLMVCKEQMPKKYFYTTIIFWLVLSYFLANMIYLICNYKFMLIIYEIIFLLICLIRKRRKLYGTN